MKLAAGLSASLLWGLLLHMPVASAQQSGKWTVGPMTESAGVFAATINDSLGVLGQYCYKEDGNCLYLLKTSIECVDGNKYPILVNADAGASNMELLCIKLEGKPRYAFTAFESIDSVIRNSKNIGFAFPMESGYFQISRFSLNGAANAVTQMREIAEKMMQTKKSATTRDLRL